jgi:hypothetical protein
VIRRLRALSSRLKDRLIVANGQEPAASQALARAREQGARQAAADIAAAIRSTAPRGHGQDCTIPGCTQCAVASQADRYARFADLMAVPESATATGAGR